MIRTPWNALALALAMGLPAYAGPPPTEPVAGEETAVPSIDPLPSVRRNQQVLLVALANGIRLSAPGRALKDGHAGEIIPVINTATRLGLKGVVRDGWIEIVSAGDPTP